MEDYIRISLINDFIFCPRSIYFHGLYAKYEAGNYKDKPQVAGTLKHKTIDKHQYSTSKHILQGMSIFCEKYNLGGKIDIFDSKKGELVERKSKVKKIYDGYRYQVYAQYFCLNEMGYEVKKIFIHSLIDNKRYQIFLPGKKETKEFEDLLKKIRNYHLHQEDFTQNKEKCRQCIYASLCDFFIS